jgi:hypothetical protein
MEEQSVQRVRKSGTHANNIFNILTILEFCPLVDDFCGTPMCMKERQGLGGAWSGDGRISFNATQKAV